MNKVLLSCTPSGFKAEIKKVLGDPAGCNGKVDLVIEHELDMKVPIYDFDPEEILIEVQENDTAFRFDGFFVAAEYSYDMGTMKYDKTKCTVVIMLANSGSTRCHGAFRDLEIVR